MIFRRRGIRQAVSVAVLLEVSACGSAPAPPVDVPEVHAVFNAAIEYTVRTEEHTPPFAIGSMTEGWDLEGDEWHADEMSIPGVDEDWADGRAALSASPCVIDVALLGTASGDVVQLTGDDGQLLGAFGYGLSGEEEQKIPGVKSAIHLSRPYVAPDGRRAVIYVSVLCGMLCGDGKYLALERRDAGWRVVAEYRRWIS